MPGGEAFYYMHERGELMGAVLTHVDDFIITESEEFVEKNIVRIVEVLTVSKLGRDKFIFTAWDMQKYENGERVCMREYADSFKLIENIQRRIDTRYWQGRK